MNMHPVSKSKTYGEIEIDGETYGILSCPISDRIAKEIHKYCTDEKIYRLNKTCKWSIVGNKLYLNELSLNTSSKEHMKNMVQKLFNNGKIFADWQNKDIKLLLKKEVDYCVLETSKEHLIMHLRILKFKDGILIEANDVVEEHMDMNFRNLIRGYGDMLGL